MSPLPLALLGGAAFLEFCLAYYERGGARAIVWTQIVAGIVFLVLCFVFRDFTIRVDESTLSFAFGPIRKNIALAKIVGAYADEATLMTTGIGIHIVRAGYWAWVARPGTAVRIVLAPGSASPGFIISTDRPRDLIAAVTAANLPLDAPPPGRPGAAK